LTSNLKRVVTYALSFGLAGFLLYLAVRGQDLNELKEALYGASFIWTVPLIIVILISHFIRAWRWKMLLEALPDHQRSGELQSVSLKTSFLSVMIGYFVNLITLRLGEIIRTANMARQERLRFSGVLGTVVVERILDLFILFIGIVSLSVLFSEQFLFLQEQILNPLISIAQNISIGWTLAGISSIFAVGFIALRTINTSNSKRILNIRRRVISVFNAFRDGILTVLRSPNRVGLIGSTLLMWGFYAIMTYIPLVMLDMHTTYNLGALSAWSLMIFGALGMAAPSPSGTGSYHYITTLVLANLYMVDDATAFIYAAISHGFHMIVYIAAGFIAFAVQGVSLKSLKKSAQDLEET